MKLIAPDYYPDFHCIADRCRHSCCIGWEIEIDDETLVRYRSVPGAFGDRLTAGIRTDGECACFRLSENERCPFLNESGLCDIILNLGEDYLSQICTDHPRFRNFFSDRTEIGLGLCCEAAGRLILGNPKQPELIILEDDGQDEELHEDDKLLLQTRGHLIAIAQNRNLSLDARMSMLLDSVGLAPCAGPLHWTAFYRSLEQLDPAWDRLLCALSEASVCELPDDLHTDALEQLLVYFLYRHLSDSLDDVDLAARTAFAVHGTIFIRALCGLQYQRSGTCSFDDLVEIARLYSSEIEYSDSNLDALLAALLPE